MLPLPPAFVVTADAARLAQFREAWRAVGLPPDAVAECEAAYTKARALRQAEGGDAVTPRIPSLFRAVLAALFLQLAATVYAVASFAF